MNAERQGLWTLRGLALAIALLLWYFFALQKREDIAERLVEASVTYNTPQGLIILDPVQQVRVRLRGPSRRMRVLNPSSVDVTVVPSAVREGSSDVRLGPENVAAPDGVEVVAVEPNSMRLRVDREMSAMISVRAMVAGEPAAGALVHEIRVTPERTLVRGPRSRVEALTQVQTSTILLDGHALPFSERAAVLSPDPLVLVEPSTVEVRIELQSPESFRRVGGSP
jgi:YbbR domain-containing protein